MTEGITHEDAIELAAWLVVMAGDYDLVKFREAVKGVSS